ncbi:hypothetical protein BU15DRAFT_90233 [Melanogaster broomeanus]|nr:hypothetical protein BU15DRAFT_90233 [Melanogaster broomeanus]
MFAVAPLLTILAAAAISVRADPTPNNPGPGDVFIEGQSCAVGWTADTTGVWKNMSIELMTGSNLNMVFLTTVGTVDGTDPTKTTFSYPCPQVSPYSPIYFYQFTSPASTDLTWTGRFTITDSANDIVPPTESTQPNGDQIPWGTGVLVGGASAVPAPSGVPGSASATGTALGTPTVSVTPSSTPSVTPSGSITPSSATSSPVTPASKSGSSATPGTVTFTMSSAPTTASSTPNGAMTMLSVSSILWQTTLALGVSAVGFAVMF